MAEPRPPAPGPLPRERSELSPMDVRRTLRVSEAVREELSELIGFETQDPRLLAVEVLEVHVSSDGRHANVVVAARGSEREQRESMAALEHARHYLRHEMAMRLSLRHIPELHFEQEKKPDVESRIDFLLRRAKKSRGRTEN
jgi:ribosome-binding factor A